MPTSAVSACRHTLVQQKVLDASNLEYMYFSIFSGDAQNTPPLATVRTKPGLLFSPRSPELDPFIARASFADAPLWR